MQGSPIAQSVNCDGTKLLRLLGYKLLLYIHFLSWDNFRSRFDQHIRVLVLYNALGGRLYTDPKICQTACVVDSLSL
jgi:hypothetical protein